VVVAEPTRNATLPLDSNETISLNPLNPYPCHIPVPQMRAFALNNTSASDDADLAAYDLHTAASAASTMLLLGVTIMLIMLAFNPRPRCFAAALVPCITLAVRYSGALAVVTLQYSLHCLSWMLYVVTYPYRWFGPLPVAD
jgi:hypothetical protein